MNVFFHELRSYRKSVLIWAVSLSFLLIVFMGMFPAFTQDVDATRKILASFPEAIRKAFDMSLEHFFTIYGFQAYLLTFIALAGAVQAMNLSVGIMSKEESGKTADFILSKPISRTKVLTNKILAALCLIIFTNVVFCAVSLSAATVVSKDGFEAGIYMLICLTLFLIQLFFLAFGFLLGVLIPKIKSVVSVSLPAVFAFFVIGMLGEVLGNEEARLICPFKFFDSNYIIEHGAYEVKYLLIELCFIILAIIATYIIFIKKDIRAAS